MDLMGFTRGDAYNLQVFSQLLLEIGYAFPTQALRNGWPETMAVTVGRSNRWRSVVKDAGKLGLRVLEEGMGHALGKRCRVALCDMYLPRTLTWALAWRTGLRAIPIELRKEWSFTIPRPAFDQRRNDLTALASVDEFERIFVQSLPQNLPILYLEGFDDARSETLRRYHRIPCVVTSSAGWDFNETFKFLAAEAAEKGSRLVAVQHGGGYGIYRYMPSDLHQTRLSDSFMVWGWGTGQAPSLRNLPSPKLSSLLPSQSRKASSRKAGPILFVATTNPLYLYRFYSCPVGSQFGDYFEWELRFLAAASDRLRRTILFRPHPVDYGWAVSERISDRFSDIRWDNGQPIYQRLKRSRMVVIDHLSTTLLETLVANIPTVLFWNPQRWEVRDEAEPYFESLRKVGILWNSPEEAAAKVADVYDEPWAWWGNEEVQEVRRRFADRYALGRRDWAGYWARALREEVTLSQARKQ